MPVLPEMHQCTTLCCEFDCFGAESERNGLTRAGQKFWKGPVGLVGTQGFRKHKHLFLARLTATTNAVVSHYAF